MDAGLLGARHGGGDAWARDAPSAPRSSRRSRSSRCPAGTATRCRTRRRTRSTGIPADQLRATPLGLPELNEPQVIRHFVNLSHLNYSVDGGFYPLGSCTMKYNPKVNEWAARLPGFATLHPLAPDALAQGTLQLLWELQGMLSEISGMHAVTLQPAAGAHGELTGHPADPRLPPRPRRHGPGRGHRARLVARHQSRDGLDGRLQDGDRAVGAGRRRGPRRAAGGARPPDRGGDAHQPVARSACSSGASWSCSMRSTRRARWPTWTART